MHILGYSGLAGSVPFKRRRFPTLDDRYYRIAEGLNSAAALVDDGRIVAAAAEERFVRRKGTGEFPKNAMEYCVSAGGITIDEVDLVAHAFNYRPYRDRFESSSFHMDKYADVFAPQLQVDYMTQHFAHIPWSDKVEFIPHHIAHAASAYYLSGFSESLIVVLDGSAEVHATTIAVGNGSDIQVLRTIPTHASLGLLYGIFTMYLGFTMDMHEYKVMAMAGYGDPTRYFAAIMSDIQLHGDGTFDIPLLRRDSTVSEMETHAGVIRYLGDRFGPPRLVGEQFIQRHFDLAAGIQAVLEKCITHCIRHFGHETGMNNLCLAGGVALNCKTNSLLHRSRMFRSIFIQPAAGDDGAALGAALYSHAIHEPDHHFSPMELPLWGPEESDAEIYAALSATHDIVIHEHVDIMSATEATARLLADGEVVAWHQGRMEFGPRALGNRSILADPRHTSTSDQINQVIKDRDHFQPFAPSVLAENAHYYFGISDGDLRFYHFMTSTAQVRQQFRNHLAAVTHVDGSARVQVVHRHLAPTFWQLLSTFSELSGIHLLLNTSLNLSGMPISCTVDDSLKILLTSPLNNLCIGRYIVSKA